MEPEPIPLRALTVLLKYELLTSDPRFENVRLTTTIVADSDMLRHATIKPNLALPSSIQQTKINLFKPYQEPVSSEPPSAICQIHPDASQDVKNLNSAELEVIYHETRFHDSCYKAAGLYQFFFDHCSKGQKVSIQIRDEEPILVDIHQREVFYFFLNGPKLHTVTVGAPENRQHSTGSRNGEDHVVVGFENPGKPKELVVVDMTSMQYGENGRGIYGESYYLGPFDVWKSFMSKICETVVFARRSSEPLQANENVHKARIMACAQRAWARWQNRKNEGWCSYCGKGGQRLMNCGSCKVVKVKYCCKEHQRADWKLHKHTCEKNKPAKA